MLEDPAIKKCGHNIKFDARILANAGVKLRGVVFDSMLASILLDPAKPGHKLEQLALDLLGYAMIPISDLIGSGDGSISMAEVPLEKVGPYAAEDADISLRLYHQLLPQIRAAGMEELLTRVEAPLAVVLAEMERNGITCDPEELMRQGEELSRRVEKLEPGFTSTRDASLTSTRPSSWARCSSRNWDSPPGSGPKQVTRPTSKC